MTRLHGKPSTGISLILASALLASTSPSHAQTKMPSPADLPPSFTTISPIFSQLVSFSMPANFIVGFENTNNGRYTREAVPEGETVQQWSEMITVTGAQGLAGSPNGLPENFALTIAAGFKRACPETFAAKARGATRIGEHDAFMAVVGCGRVGNGAAAYSETTLIIAIKGTTDVYTLQWAERGAATDKAEVENPKWRDRLQRLLPIKLCLIIPGEAPPYPSCLGKG
jgi:hypothetical protein